MVTPIQPRATQQIHSKNVPREKLRTRRDLIILSGIALVVFILAVRFQLFEKLVAWSLQHEAWQIDEIIIMLLVCALAISIFALRRWREVNQEVAERRRAEEALRASEASFRVLFANNPQPMWVCDLETLQFLEVNEAAVRQYGYTRDEFLRMRLADIRPAEDVPRLLEHLKQDRPALQSSGEWRHRFKDGRMIDVEITSHTLEFAGRKAALVLAQDITERKRSEERVKLFRALIDQANDAIEVVDPESGRFLDVNEKACLDLGYSREELLSLRVSDIDRTVAPSMFQRGVEELRKSVALTWEGIHLRKDGSTFPVEVNIKYVQIDRGYVVTVVRDITERKRTEQALRQSLQRFSKAFHAGPTAMSITRSADGLFLDVNSQFLKLYGYDREEVIGRTSLELNLWVDPNDRQKFWQEHVTEQAMLRDCEVKARTKSGEIRDVLLSIEWIELEGELCALALASDITDRKRTRGSCNCKAWRSNRPPMLLSSPTAKVTSVGSTWRLSG